MLMYLARHNNTTFLPNSISTKLKKYDEQNSENGDICGSVDLVGDATLYSEEELS